MLCSLGSCVATAVAMYTRTPVVMKRGGSDMKVPMNLSFWLPCGYVQKDAAQAKSSRGSIQDEILSVKDLQYNCSSEILNLSLHETTNKITRNVCIPEMWAGIGQSV